MIQTYNNLFNDCLTICCLFLTSYIKSEVSWALCDDIPARTFSVMKGIQLFSHLANQQFRHKAQEQSVYMAISVIGHGFVTLLTVATYLHWAWMQMSSEEAFLLSVTHWHWNELLLENIIICMSPALLVWWVFVFKYDLGQKYYVSQVRPDRRVNLINIGHDKSHFFIQRNFSLVC